MTTSFLRFGGLVLMLALCSLACQFGAATSTATVVPVEVAPSATEDIVIATDVPSPSPIPSATSVPTEEAAADLSVCKLPAAAVTNVGLGFPVADYNMRSTGTVTGVVLFVDYTDAPAEQTPEEVFAILSPTAENFYKALSYGRMDFVLKPSLNWLRLSQPSAYYAQAITTFEGHQAFIQEAVDLAGDTIDYSEADTIIVIGNPAATTVGYGPAYISNISGVGVQAGGRTIGIGVTSGNDLLYWGGTWLNHETGHSMSLADLYAYEYEPEDGFLNFTGSWGLMGDIGGRGPEFFAFERWQLGWLDDDQIVCNPAGGTTTTITPIEIAGGIKAVIVPTGPTSAVIVESRRAIGYDTRIVKPGVLVYTVDTSIPSGYGPLQVLPIDPNDPAFDHAPLGVGESLTVGAVTITVIEASDQGDTVLIEQ